MENVASDVMGAINAAKAKIQGLSGVFQQLTREHGEVAALLFRVKMTSDAKVRAELFPKIRSELLSHEKGELTVVYPVFRERLELTGFAQDHDREAGLLEAQIRAISALAYDDARWADRFAELVDLATKHTKDEENTYFPAAQRILGSQASEELLSPYRQAKARAAGTSS
jgi:hemerythrin superfamily protein